MYHVAGFEYATCNGKNKLRDLSARISHICTYRRSCDRKLQLADLLLSKWVISNGYIIAKSAPARTHTPYAVLVRSKYIWCIRWCWLTVVNSPSFTVLVADVMCGMWQSRRVHRSSANLSSSKFMLSLAPYYCWIAPLSTHADTHIVCWQILALKW